MYRREQPGGSRCVQGADVREGCLAEEGPRAVRRIVQGGGMRGARFHHRACYQAPGGHLLRPVRSPFRGALCCGLCIARRQLGSGHEHVRQVRDGRAVPQMHVDPQAGGTCGARLAVRGGLRALDGPLQRLLLRAPARARRWLGPGARGHLGALRAPVGARQRGAGYRVAFPAEVAGVREVVGRVAGVKAAEREVVPPLAEGAPEFQQAVADTAPVVSTEGYMADCVPRVVGEYTVVVEGRYEITPRWAGVPLGDRQIGVTPGEQRGHTESRAAGDQQNKQEGGGEGSRRREPPTFAKPAGGSRAGKKMGQRAAVTKTARHKKKGGGGQQPPGSSQQPGRKQNKQHPAPRPRAPGAGNQRNPETTGAHSQSGKKKEKKHEKGWGRTEKQSAKAGGTRGRKPEKA